MKCPACGRSLKEIEVGGLRVDVCEGGCGGTWFDQLELRKVDEPHESQGEVLLDIPCDPDVRVDHQARRYCPRCGDMVMRRYFYSVKMQLEVDECPKCAGFWLDAGELRRIRGQYRDEDRRHVSSEDHFSLLFDAELERLRDESRRRSDSARSFARLFRFLLPSYYLPGKQTWGAY